MIVSLKYEIPERAGQRQIAVHPFVLDETTRCFDPLALVLQRGFMIPTKLYRLATDTSHCSAVARVSLESFSIQVRYSLECAKKVAPIRIEYIIFKVTNDLRCTKCYP